MVTQAGGRAHSPFAFHYLGIGGMARKGHSLATAHLRCRSLVVGIVDAVST
jgi:hypothetical protein